MMICCLALFSACRQQTDTASVSIEIDYSVLGKALQCDTLSYVNEAGNHFMINEIQWFISRVELQDEKGAWTAFGEGDNLYYIDTDLPETHHLLSRELPVGNYQTLRFTFGLDEADNVSGRFPNPPEANMFWPEPLGGGYHYMKLNGKWRTPDGTLAPLNIHLGVGQNPDRTEFYPNHFSVTLPIDLHVNAETTKKTIRLTMVIDNWFRNPHTYDFNHFGSAIMQNQEAQQLLKENGSDVFSVSVGSSLLNDIARPVKDLMGKAAPKPNFYTRKNMKDLLSQITHKNNRQ